ncbi:hypothetical protein VTI28DRAFT_1184 [Corynascus sepedonium]
MSSEPYDPYIPNGERSQGGGSHSNPSQIRKELDDTIHTLQQNVIAAGERGERLEDLRDKSGKMATEAQKFRRGANGVRRQMWWKDMKMRIWLAIGIIVLLAIIIIPSVVVTKSNK